METLSAADLSNGAPALIHVAIWAIASSGSFLPLNGMPGSSRKLTSLYSLLSFALPGTTTGPLSPPRTRPSEELRSSPPCFVFGP